MKTKEHTQKETNQQPPNIEKLAEEIKNLKLALKVSVEVVKTLSNTVEAIHNKYEILIEDSSGAFISNKYKKRLRKI